MVVRPVGLLPASNLKLRRLQRGTLFDGRRTVVLRQTLRPMNRRNGVLALVVPFAVLHPLFPKPYAKLRRVRVVGIVAANPFVLVVRVAVVFAAGRAVSVQLRRLADGVGDETKPLRTPPPVTRRQVVNGQTVQLGLRRRLPHSAH